VSVAPPVRLERDGPLAVVTFQAPSLRRVAGTALEERAHRVAQVLGREQPYEGR
jgi:hypothetical protein